MLNAAGVIGTLHIIGEGPLRENIIRASQRSGPFRIQHVEPIAYGPDFMNFLQHFHAIVVPSLSDEQPRIIFDAAACAMPVLASDTDGLRSHIENNHTGCLLPPGDANVLAETMTKWMRRPELLRNFGMEALRRVCGKTHQAMHIERSHIIDRHFGADQSER